MNSNKTNKLKLLVVGVFITLATTVFSQSITVKHYENGNLTTPSFFTNNTPRLCAVDSVQLEATGFSGTLNWSGPNGTINSTSSSIWVSDEGWYYLSDGNSNSSVEIGKDNVNPEIYTSDYPITASSTTGVGTDQNSSSPSGGLFGILNASKDYLAPFGAEYAYNKQQYLYNSSELQNLGLDEGTAVKEIGFYLNSSWNSNCNSSVEIRVYETNTSSLTSFESSSSTYLGSWGCLNFSSGWNYFDLNDFEWDGTKNIVFEFCYSSWNNSTAQNPEFALDNVGFNASVVVANVQSVCSATSGYSIANYRPSTAFKYSNAARKDTIVLCGSTTTLQLSNSAANYSWSSLSGNLSGSVSTLSVASDDLIYVSGFTNSICHYDDTVQVYSAAQPTPIVTASSTDFCSGETVALSTLISSNENARWSTGVTGSQISVVTGGEFTVTVSNEFGCSATSLNAEINEIKKPQVFLDDNGFDILNSDSHFFSVDYSMPTPYYYNEFKKFADDGNGTHYFISNQSLNASSLPSLISDSKARLVSIDNSTENDFIHSAHNAYYNSTGNAYHLLLSGKYNYSTSNVDWENGSTSTFTKWWNNTSPSQNRDGSYLSKYYYSDEWEAHNNTYEHLLIEYQESDLKVPLSGAIYCDSVQLFASSSFDTFLWSTGETSSSIWVSVTGSNSVSLTGTYTKSDGTTCSLTSDTYTFTINPSPSLTITNESGTEDLNGTNTIELEATYTSGSTISWSTGASADSIFVTSAGEYTATVDLNGCTTIKTANIYEPIFVDDDGSDITGTGTLASPYETLSKGLTEVTSGGKVYVLPGTYQETVNITKNVFIASDYYRLQDSAALHSTIIDGEGQRRLVNYNNITENLDSSKSKIVGFTMTGGFEENDEGAGIYGGWNVSGTTQIKNCLIEDISRKCCASGIVLGWMSNAHLIMDSVFVKDIGQANYGDQRRAFYITNGQLTLRNSVVENTEHDKSLFNLQNSAILNLENVRITDVHENYQDYGAVFYLDGSSKAYLNHVTIDNIYLESRYIARILSNNVTFHVVNSVVDDAKGRFIWDQSSGVAEIEIHNSVIGNGESGYTGSYLSSLPGVGQDGSLADNSEAIGYANSNVLVGSKQYTSPLKDVTGIAKPAPLGSAPDAGAYESDKAQGDFDVLLAQCGYLLEANVLNSSAYSVEWLLNSQVVSTDESWLASNKGLYTVNVYSTDRSDTITKTINLSNPLEFEVFTSKDICTEISSSNGEITYGNVSGGTEFNNNNWWSYRGGLTGLDITYQNTNYFQSNNSHEGSYNLSAGTYYAYVEDGLGCIVGDTIVLVDQEYARYYVSTTGDDTNDGKSQTTPFETIERALTKVCDLDQVVILDGLYQEDSLTVDRQVVLASEYLIDNDTSHIHNTRIKGSNKSIFYYATNRSSWSDTATSQLVGITLLPGKSSNYNEAASISRKEASVLKLKKVIIDSASNTGFSGIRWNDSKLAIQNVSITNSVDQTSPLIYTNYTSVDIDGLRFINNFGSELLEVRYAYSVNLKNVEAKDNYLTSSAFEVFYPFSNFDINNVVIKNNRLYRAFNFNYGGSNEEGWLSNALIVNNEVTSGSAIQSYQFRGNFYLNHNTIADNYQASSTSVRSLYHRVDQNYSGTSLKVFGNILQSDATSAIKVEDNSSFNVIGANNLIDGGSLFATNNITATVNNQRVGILDFNEDYMPSKYSKALGGGASSSVLGGTSFTPSSLDVYGNARSNPLNSNPDIGAVESPLDTFEQGIIVVHDDNGFCETSAGVITVTALNYSGAKTYNWVKLGDANWTLSDTDSIANGLDDGTYSVAVSDSLNNTIGDTTITISTRPTIGITDLSQDVLCFGNGDAELSFELAGGNPFGASQYQYNIQYLDSPPLGVQVDSMGGTYYFQETLSSSFRAGLYTNSYNVYQGNYYVIVTDLDGCTVDDTISIGNQYMLPVVSISTESNDGILGLTSACNGASIDISVSATSVSATSYTYEWGTQETTNQVNVDESGDYYVEVTDNFTCVNRDTLNIYFQDEPVMVIEKGTPPAYSGNNISGIYGTSSTYIGQYGENHYYYIDSYKTWLEAKQLAEGLGGRLPIINDYSKNSWLAQNIRDNVSNRDDPWIGVYHDGSDWVDANDNSLSFSYWWGSQSNSSYSQPYSTYKYGYIGYWGDWYNSDQYQTRTIVVEFAPMDLPINNSMSFCDSVELKALDFADFGNNSSITDPSDQGFKQVYWKDANGTILDSGEYVTFSNSESVQLEGVFLRSDGSECSLNSDVIEINIVSSPSLTFSTYDSLNNQYFNGSNILACSETELYTTVSVTSDTSNSFTFTWSTGESDSVISINSSSVTTVTVTDVLGCYTMDSLSLFKKPEPIISKSVVNTDTSVAYYGASYIPNFNYQGQIGNNYIYASSYATTWSQARHDALTLGGDLASFSTESEYNTLASWSWDYRIVGLNDSVSEGVWQFSDGTPVTYLPPSWGQGEPSNSGNEDYIAISYYNFNDIDENSHYEFFLQIPIPPTEVPLVSGEAFCDSVTLIASETANEDSTTVFSKVYWKDAANGAIVDSSETLKVMSSINLYLEGHFDQSNGTACSILGDTLNVIINETPDLTAYSADSTFELTTDTINLIAFSNAAGANITWQVDTNIILSDTLAVSERGLYSATASLNGCSVSEDIFVDQPLFVAKSGSDATGDGSFTNPYLTIQKGVDQAISGQKIYVLPGTYQETVDIDKSVTIESDYVRLGTDNARNTTIIDGNGSPCIEIDNVSNDIVVNVNGFRLRDASQTSNSNQGALSINNSNNTTFTLMNSSITQSANSGDCCGRGGIINAESLRELTLINVDIFNNGSLTQEARFPINLTNISGGVKIENSTIKSNSFTQWLFQVHNADLEVVNSIIAENSSQWNDRDIFQLEGDGASIKLNHVTSYGNNQNQLVGLIGINYGSPTIEIYNSIIDADEIINTSEDYTVSNSLLSIGNVFKGSGTNLGANNVQSTIQLQSGYTLPATSPAIGLADILNGNITNDRNGWSRPLPAGSNPDAGAIEDSLALGEFDFYLSNCGDYININLLNTDSYSINVTGPANFSSSNLTTIQVGGLGQYSVSVYDSLTSASITKTINYNNPLNIGLITVQDACPSNQGYGSITLGDYTGGSRFNYPNDSYWAYTVDIIDSSGNSVANDWHVPDNAGHQNNVSVQSGQYILILTDASGCSIYDTVNVEDLIGSKYYISTTGSDTATGAYSDPLATIQEALNRSCDGDTIILFDGEYFENVKLTNTYLPYVTIASEYIEDGVASHISNTIVNGMDEDPVFDISNHNSTTDTIVFVGFTITNGKSSNWYGGGGISMYYSNIALKNMQVSGNRSGDYGGGIGMYEGYLNLWNTVIENNIASGHGGGIRAYYMYRIDGHGSTIIQNNKSNSNGGGISYSHGHWGSTNEDFYIRGFEIVNNSADGTGGLHVSNWGNNNGTLEIDNIKVVNNRSTSYGAGGASISNNGEDAILSNVIISSNRSNSIGGLELHDVDINIVHSTVYANGVVDGTSANDQIRLQNNSNVLFLNSAVGGQQNVGTSIAHTFYLDDYDTTCDLTISNSIVSGGTNSIDNPYSSNIVGTPIGQALYLVNPQQGDYMLSSVSQGLGAGTSSYTGVTMPMIDIEGGLRPNPIGSDPDVGAVESPLDSATFGAAYEIRNNIACDPTYGRLKVIPLNGSGSYKYELDDLTGSATFTDQTNVSSYTYSSLYSGNYLVTITDLSSSDEFTDTVTISGKDSLILNLVYNDIFCAGEANGGIAAIVSGGDGYYDYTWSTISNSNWPKSNKLNNLNPDEYYITVKDGDNCFAEDSVTLSTLHSLPLVAITGNIDKGGTTTQTTNPQVRACAGDIVTLDAGAGYVSYNWTTIDQLNSWSTQMLSASYEEGFYVTVIDSFGCTNTDTAEVFYVQSPAIFASNVNTNIGGTYQQVTSYIEGTNQSTGLNSEPKPYGANERFAKMQFIIPANELIAEGLTDQTAINSLGFEVDIASGSAVQNFKIKVKNTTSNQVGYTFESGLTQVYDFNVLTAGDGWNTHEFDQGFVWDGTKNLLVQVEYSNVAFTNGMDSYLIGHSTSYNSSSVATNSASSVANQTSANNVWSWRPNMKFGIDKVQATDTLRVCDFTMLNTTDDYDTYAWLVAGSSQGTQLRYSMSSPNEVVLKTVDAASSCTMYSDTVQVLLDTTPSVFVTSPVLAGCIGDSVIAAVDTVQSGLTYNWSNGVSDTLATFTESGSYYVYAVSPSGCEGVDTVNVSINIPPDVVIELNGRVLTSTDGNLVADNSSCDTTLILPYYSAVDTLSALNNSEWSTYSNNFLEWEYQQGWDSLQDYTGPNYDADSNYFGGFYQFDPASLTDQNKVGYLQLGCINLLGMTNPELSFEYHMVDVYADSSNTSDQMGDLALQLKAAGDADWNTVWQRSGTDATYDWASKSVALDGYVNQTVQVRWKATAGVGGPRSEMGLDNILVSDSLAALSNVSGRITAETVCEGDSLYAQAVSNGTTSFGYLWSTGDTTSAISLQTTGWYAVSVMDEENCTVQTDSVFVEVNPAPNNLLVVSDTTQYCAGTFDSLIIAATAGYNQYEWYFKQASAPSPTPQSCSFDIVLTDSYGDGWNGAIAQLKDTAGTVIYTLGSGFTAGSSYIETVTLTSGETYSIEVSAIGSYVSEIGLEVMKDTVMIGSYQNTSSTSLGTVMFAFTANCGATVTNDAGGYAMIDSVNAVTVDSIISGTNSYYVTITDSIGCKATSETVDLIQRDIPSLVMTSAPVLCNNDSTGQAMVQASGSGGFTFEWSNNQDSNVIDNITDGWYSVTVTDSFSCSTIDSVLVVEPSEVSLTAVDSSDVNCFGGNDGFATYTFTGGVGNYQYSWTDSSGVWSSDSLNLTNASAGMYFLNAADSNGCLVLDTVSIGEPPVLALTIDSTSDLTCYQNADGYLSATVTGGFGSYNYYIDGVAAGSLTIDSLDAGSHVVSVIDDNGCSDSASFTLTEPVLLTASTSVVQYLGGIQVSCIGATDGAIDVFVNGGTLPYNYLWADGDTTEDRSNIGAGSYSMTVTDEQGCTVSVNELISEPSALVATSLVDSLDCYGASDGSIAYTLSGATAPYITSWSSITGSSADSVLATFQVNMNGASINTGGIELITNSGQNYNMNLVPVLEDSIYRVTISVAVGSTLEYRFFNGSTAETVSSSCGVNVGGTIYRSVTIGSDTTLVAIEFSGCTTTGSAYSGALTGSTRSLTGLSAGSYELTISDVNGCNTILIDSLIEPDSIQISAIVYDASCPQTPDGFIDVTATGGSGSLMYNWSTTDTTEDLTAAYGYYTVTVTDAKGCMDSATYLVDAPFPYNDEELCVVTVDTTGVNLVVWEKTPSQRTADYVILRENAATQYVSVGNNTYLNMSTWADQNSNPAVQPYRYKLVLQDSCGNYSDTSDYHATIHLQASQGVAQNEVNLQWTAYEGKQVQTYYIYRWLSPINRVLVDSVSSNVYTYTDIYPVTTTITALLYEVGAKFVNGGCSPSTGKQSSYANSMSNVLDWGQDGGLPIGTEEWVDVVLGNDLDIYPNPTRGALNLELKGAWEEQEDIQIKITDMTGRILAYRITQGAGTVRFDFEELPAGIYFLNIITGEGRTIVKRFERVN